MIREKDVIRMYVPFPRISSSLAVYAHMYICGNDNSPHYGFIKCQTLKPTMIGSDLLHHFVDEAADISRNPFYRATRIDCDKFFVTHTVSYHDALKTPSRPDVCQELYDSVKTELAADGYREIRINETELLTLNPLITR